MNLLCDPWVPVRDQEGFRHVTLSAVLCEDRDWRISLPRDDMELAALQLAVCLTQTILTPGTSKDLRARERTPLTPAEYDEAAARRAGLFDLCHPKHPFMQTPETKADKQTPVQRLFVGLPDRSAGSGESQAFFNGSDEIARACLPCTAVALFQHCTNGVNFGGGFMSGLKGMAPVTTLIGAGSLRRTIWRNVLHRDLIRQGWSELPDASEACRPTWDLPIRRRGSGRKPAIEPASEIGLVRGLFWQSARVRLLTGDGRDLCGNCGQPSPRCCSAFVKEQDPFEYQEFWRHPHTPFEYREKDGELKPANLRADDRGRFWPQMVGLFWETSSAGEPGYRPALVVVQHRSVWPGQRITLVVGGYVNDQAKIRRRAHEMWTLGEGWEGQTDQVQRIIEPAVGIPKVLWSAVASFAATSGQSGLSKDQRKAMGERAENIYLARTEPEVHARLREILDWRAAAALRDELAATLVRLARATYEEVVAPYRHSPSGLRAATRGRAVLLKGLAEFEDHHAGRADKCA